MRKILLYYNTIKYLKFKQIFYRGYYFLRKRIIRNNEKQVDFNVKSFFLNFHPEIYSNTSYKNQNKFLFLNKSKLFVDTIDWDFSEFGKLWTYNLNYFDYLNQYNLSKEKGVELIYDYIKNDQTLKVGKEPYPISLRNINWIKFISRNKIEDERITKNLFKHYLFLLDNLEYHLLGNHLLENGFSLLFGAYFFRNERLYKKAKKIIIDEVNEQTLKDGGHFELSSMYHQIILFRLLECIFLVDRNEWKNDIAFYTFLKNKAVKMLSFLKTITYRNGDVPMVNDSAYGIAPTSRELFDFAQSLGLEYNSVELDDSGYRKIEISNYELFIDVGNVGPDYQLGHAHSDIFNFELHCNGKPIIVDTGTSTYEKNFRRHLERATSSHNTVKIGEYEQTQVWGGFRVAKRAKILNVKEKKGVISASHDGFKGIGFIHTRIFEYYKNQIIINDIVSNDTNGEANAYLHFAQGINLIIDKKKVFVKNENVVIEFEGAISVSQGIYELAKGFNQTVNVSKLIITFNRELKTKISL